MKIYIQKIVCVVSQIWFQIKQNLQNQLGYLSTGQIDLSIIFQILAQLLTDAYASSDRLFVICQPAFCIDLHLSTDACAFVDW